MAVGDLVIDHPALTSTATQEHIVEVAYVFAIPSVRGSVIIW